MCFRITQIYSIVMYSYTKLVQYKIGSYLGIYIPIYTIRYADNMKHDKIQTKNKKYRTNESTECELYS